MIPKIELHVHLEGTAPPSLVKRLADRHHMQIPENLLSDADTFRWNNFLEFLNAYDLASAVIRTPEDYRDVTYEYLAQSAREGVIYAELMSSPDHAANAGMSYLAHLEGVIQGIEDAKRDFKIEGRIIITGVRHFGPEKVEKVAELAAKHSHPLVVGLGLGGDEGNYPPKQFSRAYEIAHEAGLGTTVHAGEISGPEGVREALSHLPVTRLGHGVRIIEDRELMAEIVDKQITLECCPTSNIALKIFPSYAQHPLRALYEAGVRITLNSDDPPYFATTIGKEYDIAREMFGFTLQELNVINENAVNASFADKDTKKSLLQKITTPINQNS